jgi:hypothetical protein
MKKHVFGIAIFVTIIGISGIAYSVFVRDTPIICSFPVNPENYVDDEIQPSQHLIKQAVLDLKTKQINWEFDQNKLKANIALHFYAVDSNGSKYLKTEYVRTTRDFKTSYLWLNSLKSYENLYVIADEYPNTHRGMSSIPAFDMSKATPILLYSRANSAKGSDLKNYRKDFVELVNQAARS